MLATSLIGSEDTLVPSRPISFITVLSPPPVATEGLGCKIVHAGSGGPSNTGGKGHYAHTLVIPYLFFQLTGGCVHMGL